jgi:hypothetical protein
MGLINYVFSFLIKKKLLNDDKFLDGLKKYLESKEKLQKKILDSESKGVIIPDGLKKYSGLK